jgi:heme o synthase
MNTMVINRQYLLKGVVSLDKAVKSADAGGDYVPHHVMEPGPLADKHLTGTWKDYISVTKVGIIVSNLLTVLTGMWLAAGGAAALFGEHALTMLLTLVGTTFIIASGTCLNNYYDRDIDAKMARTKSRALVEGRLDPQHVLWMGGILGLFGTLVLLFVNILTTMVALFGLFGYIVLYTMWTKRTTHLNTIVGSFAGAVPPMIGWSAITGGLEAGAWILFLIMFLWQPPHFLAIAMRRCEDYRNAGIPMLPVVRGFELTKKQIVLYVGSLLPASLYLVFVTNLGMVYIWFALALGFGWLGLSFIGLVRQVDDIRWARQNFIYSLMYMTLLFVGIMALTF